jgi:hypothetical protein
MTIFDFCEKMPEFPSGDSALLDFLLKNIGTVYYLSQNKNIEFLNIKSQRKQRLDLFFFEKELKRPQRGLCKKG